MSKADSLIKHHPLLIALCMLFLFHTQQTSSIAQEVVVEESALIEMPTAKVDTTDVSSLASQDSIEVENQKKLDELNKKTKALDAKKVKRKNLMTEWKPNPTRATWYAIIFPGGGQIYNRKYWKLPILYGGFAGCFYALNWNNTMYKDYAQAYRDLKDNNPNTNSYLELLPPNAVVDSSRLESLLKNRKDRFRRYRDLSIIAFIGVYALSIIDAYVDAELSNFDISPDLSLRIEPAIIKSDNSPYKVSSNNFGLQCRLTF